MLNSSSKMPLMALKSIPESELRRFCEIMWGWEYCQKCSGGQVCTSVPYSWSKKAELDSFLQYYASKTLDAIHQSFASSRSALKTHGDLIDIVQILKQNKDVTRSVLTAEHWQQYEKNSQPSREDHDRAFEVAIAVMTMVDCSKRRRSWSQCELGLENVIWRDDQSLSQFRESILPVGKNPPLVVRQLTAALLQKAGIKFRGTSNLAHHLIFNRGTGLLWIYHHTSFLKVHLKATREGDQAKPQHCLEK